MTESQFHILQSQTLKTILLWIYLPNWPHARVVQRSQGAQTPETTPTPCYSIGIQPLLLEIKSNQAALPRL